MLQECTLPNICFMYQSLQECQTPFCSSHFSLVNLVFLSCPCSMSFPLSFMSSYWRLVGGWSSREAKKLWKMLEKIEPSAIERRIFNERNNQIFEGNCHTFRLIEERIKPCTFSRASKVKEIFAAPFLKPTGPVMQADKIGYDRMCRSTVTRCRSTNESPHRLTIGNKSTIKYY